MRRRTLLICFVWSAFALCLLATSASAQGVIVPGRCTRCPVPPPVVPLPNALPVKSVRIETKIAGQVATTHVEQIFRNDTDATLEGTYFFPIPESASVSEFAIWDGDRRLVGEVRSREEARRIYEEIVRRKRDPGLLEYAGRDLFQASIFPIPPRSDKKLELTYTQVLKAESGTVAYRYPLGTGRNVSTIGTVTGRVEIEGREPIRNVYSPTHALDLARQNERRVRATFEARGGREAQDFQLFYGISREDFGLTLLTHREPGKMGYFLLTISPKDEAGQQEYVAKDIIFVLDTSGSMAEAGKMEKARAALLYGVRSLHAEDRFNIISFAGEEHLMATGLVQADAPGRAQGEEFVRNLRPVGGTNINDALLASLRQFDSSERPRMLIFMTDGLPTVGTTNAPQIVENVRTARREGVRLFTFGVGYDVNTMLLDKLAAENGGVAEYVEPKEDLEVKVSNFFTKINYPVMTSLALDMGGVETDLVYPRQLPDLFRGTQLTLIGRYRNSFDLPGAILRLTGRVGAREQTVQYANLRFPLTETENDFLPRLWATRRVGWLMEQIRTNGEQQELRDEIVDLGTRYGIVTPYTSYLALEESERGIADVPRLRPGLSGTGTTGTGGTAMRRARGGAVSPPAPAAPRQEARDRALSTTGESAVKESKKARAQQSAVSVADADEVVRIDTVRKIGDKTFYLRDGVWVDSTFTGETRLPETTLVFGTDEYFALLKREPQLARYFALGERVIVIFKDRVYRVSEK